jgi:FecR protein
LEFEGHKDPPIFGRVLAQFTKFIDMKSSIHWGARPLLRATLLAVSLVVLTGLTSGAHAARITVLNGKVVIVRGDKTLPAVVGSRLREGDEFVSEPDSEALLRFDDGARMALRADSKLLVKSLQLKGPSATRQKTIRIVKGGLRYISGKATVKSRVSFETTTATVGIRGTDIEIAVSEDPVNNDPAGTYLKVNTGLATMAAVDGTQVDVDPGQVAFGGEPELVPRGAGGTRRPAARKVDTPIGGLFKAGLMDKLLK